jgi:hypothetical protein
MSFTRCETSSAASSPRNLSTTVAERISQLQSASSPVENTQREEFRPPRKVNDWVQFTFALTFSFQNGKFLLYDGLVL